MKEEARTLFVYKMSVGYVTQFSNQSLQKQNFNVLLLAATIKPPSGVTLIVRDDRRRRVRHI